MSAARQDDNFDLMQCAGLGVQLALTVALCTYLGYLADQWLDTLPIALLVGAFVGLGSGMWSAVKTVERVTAEGRKGKDSDGTGSGAGTGPGSGNDDSP